MTKKRMNMRINEKVDLRFLSGINSLKVRRGDVALSKTTKIEKQTDEC